MLLVQSVKSSDETRMRRKRFGGAFLLIITLASFTGCRTVEFRISTEPHDAEIYVGEAFVGNGTAVFKTGQWQLGEWGPSRQFEVLIQHPDFETFTTTIKNQYDPVYGVGWGLLSVALAELTMALCGPSADPAVKAIDYMCAALELGAGAYGVANAFRFSKEYTFTLQSGTQPKAVPR